MDYLRFITAGSVDDGKSTLIGRLLYDTDSVQVDLLEAIQRAGQHTSDSSLNLALLTDGLKAEREQGITIDVAYKYFATTTRKYIIADAPGHIQYTRNMITGASTAELVVLLVDARKGLVEQTRRHTYLASMVGVPHALLCVNKMDLVGYDQAVYDSITQEYLQLVKDSTIQDASCIPIVALNGDNIVHRSSKMDWYNGPTVLQQLESTPVQSELSSQPARFPVQYVIRPQSSAYPDYRGYAGQLISGRLEVGDKISALPGGQSSTIQSIDVSDGAQIQHLSEAVAPMSFTITLTDDIDISRGDIIVPIQQRQPAVEKRISATICWMDSSPLQLRRRYILQVNTQQVMCMVSGVTDRLNVHNLKREENVTDVKLNDIVRVELKLASPIVFDDYQINHKSGCCILIDESSFDTIAAGMLEAEPAFHI